MKFKYFLRGLGVGIVFASIVFLVAYNGKPAHKMSDADIIEKAKELGMVEKDDPVKALLTTEKDKKKTTEAKKDKNTKEKSTKEKKTSEEKQTKEDKTTEETTEKVTTEGATTEKPKDEIITVEVARGDTSYTVCQKLEAAGLIKDAAEFDTYLVENGYANRIRIDSYQFKMGMDFHDIAEIITKAS